MRRLASAALAWLLMAAAANAATYYVDQISGLDANAGTSTSAAWKTLNKVQTKAGGYAAGDIVLLKRGCTWRESLVFPTSGAVGNTITIGAYGTGAKPIIRGDERIASTAWAADEGNPGVYKITHTWTEAAGTRVRGIWENGERLTPYEDTQDGQVAGLAAVRANAGSSFHDKTTNTVYVHSAQADPNPATNGLTYDVATRPTPIDDGTHDYLVWENLDVRRGYSDLSAHIINGANNIVRYCDYYENANHHVSLFGATNLCHDCYGQDCGGGAFLVYNAVTGNVFRRIRSIGTKAWTGSAFQVHGGGNGNTFEQSWLEQRVTQTTAVAAISSSDAATNANTWRHNHITGIWKYALNCSSGSDNSVFYGNVIVGHAFTNYCVNLSATTQGVLIYNNSWYGPSWGFLLTNPATSATLRNNIGWCDFVIARDATAVLDSDYNRWHSLRASPFNDGGAAKTFANWQVAGYDANSTFGDPSFASIDTAPNPDQARALWCLADSPCELAGTNLGATYRNCLTPGMPLGRLTQQAQTGAWDIGAYRVLNKTWPDVMQGGEFRTGNAFGYCLTEAYSAATHGTPPAALAKVHKIGFMSATAYVLDTPLAVTANVTYAIRWHGKKSANGMTATPSVALVTEDGNTSLVSAQMADNTNWQTLTLNYRPTSTGTVLFRVTGANATGTLYWGLSVRERSSGTIIW